MTIAKNILKFIEVLKYQDLKVPNGFEVINPFVENDKNKINKIANIFYNKYYNDNNSRYIILGSSPARQGTAITGIPFESIEHLEKETGILIGKKASKNKASSNFLESVIAKYGGFEKFYSNFYMNFVCPLGIIRKNSNNNWVNCNYYDDKELQNSLYDFIVDMLNYQINIGVNRTKCYCIGSGENYKFLSKINEKYDFFDKIIPLEHPRFIMQYNSKDKEKFIEEYVSAFYK